MVGVSGVAGAQPTPAMAPKDKAPVPAPMPKADKPAAGAPAGAAAPKPADKPMMPAAPGEIEMMAKNAAGTWRCKGDDFDMKGGKAAMTATSTVKIDMDKWWVVETMEAKGRMTFKMVAYTTYDPTSKKWRRLAVMNDGGQMIGTSDGMKDGKMTWNLDVMSPMGAGMMRDTIDMSDPKVGMKAKGEMSMDKGKSWMPVYEMTCKK
jgi:hypothetical protein